MAISKRRGSAVRRSRPAARNRKAGAKGRILSPSEFRGEGAVPSARRKLARGAEKVSPKLNREIA
jgi:hypothetical protein